MSAEAAHPRGDSTNQVFAPMPQASSSDLIPAIVSHPLQFLCGMGVGKKSHFEVMALAFHQGWLVGVLSPVNH